MQTVPLTIIKPLHRAVFTTASVQLTGEVKGGTSGPLHYKWYSSLQSELSTVLDSSQALKVGTHAISFTAKDVAGDDEASLKSVQRIGFAGGAENPSPCVIDVLLAAIDPPTAGQPLSKATGKLKAVAPADWVRMITLEPLVFELDTDAVSKSSIRYAWIFTPSAAPQNPVRLDLNTATGIGFDKRTDAMLIVCSLPQTLPPGTYTVTLELTDTRDATAKSTASVANVTITA